MACSFPLAYGVPGRQAAPNPESLETELSLTPGNRGECVQGSADEAVCRLKLVRLEIVHHLPGMKNPGN